MGDKVYIVDWPDGITELPREEYDRTIDFCNIRAKETFDSRREAAAYIIDRAEHDVANCERELKNARTRLRACRMNFAEAGRG